MKLKYEYLSLGQLGEVFGATSHQVGRWMTQIGLRVESKKGKKPSRDAFSGGIVKDVPSNGTGYMWAWHAEKTVKALEEAGHQVLIQPGHELLAPCHLNGPFQCRPNPKIGHEIVNGDGTVAICVVGDDNARVLTSLLNIADRHGVFKRLLGENLDDKASAIASDQSGHAG